MDKETIISSTEEFVKDTLADAEGGHDWWHIYRVWQSSITIAKTEKSDLFIVELGALLHDIADAKFNGGDETVGPLIARDFLESLEVEGSVVEHVIRIIENISFRKEFDNPGFISPELNVIQDADRLDAIGAIGIARAFSYGGFKKRAMYDPDIKPILNMSKEKYKKSISPTINHFYEKLLLLKDLMKTETGKRMAEKRHAYMLDYLDEFYREWKGN